jgi:hypothetical protein
MVGKRFFCKAHHDEAKMAARRETRGLDNFHTNEEADRREQRKRGGLQQ